MDNNQKQQLAWRIINCCASAPRAFVHRFVSRGGGFVLRERDVSKSAGNELLDGHYGWMEHIP